MKRAAAATVLALLVAHAAAAADPDRIPASTVRSLQAAKLRLTPAARKLDARLQSLAWPARRALARGPLVAAAPMEHAADGRVRVLVRLDPLDDASLARLAAAGAGIEIVDRRGARVQALVDAGQLRALAAERSVTAIRPAERGRLQAGSVTSEGDVAARADLVRAMGYDGSGTVVGVISDGVDHAAGAQATNDLPGLAIPADPRCRPGGGDEGTALLEIVHDVAPGAQLLFSEGITSSLVFIDAVNCLVAAGVNVLVDDLLFFDEPFFADGPLAQAVRAAVQAGVSYHAAAGNQAEQHVEQPFRASSNGFHDFLGGPVDQTDDMMVAPGATVICILQWNDPFGGSANDYDLFLLDGTLTLITSSTGLQNGTQDPLEAAGVTNTSGSPQVVKVAINKFSGADRTLEMFCLDGDQQQYVTDGSVVAQGAVPEVVTVGAVDVSDPGRDDVESYSSRGPSQIFFPAPATRAKPDLAGFDGVSITNAGGFPACPPFCTFFGTSAAAPHSGGVAALLLAKNPFLTPAEIQDALRASAVDIGAAGFDPVAGAGRLDALAAAARVPIPECTGAAQCDDADACTIDSCLRGTCAHAAILCSDADPCTVDGCDPAGGCRSSELPGLEYLSCALGQRLRPLLPSAPRRPARALTARLDGAERILASATRHPGRRQRALLGRVRKALVALGGFARRHQRVFGQATVEAIALETNAIASRIRALQRTL